MWLARNVVGTLRAVKVVHRADFSEAHPFEREFKGIQKFEPVSRAHAGLVDILQIGRNDADGYFYYVMELADAAEPRGVAGNQCSVISSESAVSRPSLPPLKTDALMTEYSPRTLRSELRACGRLPVEECVRIGQALAEALAHLHAAGLVHRDIKPSNIIFVDGVPKLADIGLVADVDEARSFVGTEGFIPPEGPGTAQADVFSLGKVLYEMSMGRSRLDFPALPADWDALPESEQQQLAEFNAVGMKACEVALARRYNTADDLRRDLERLQQGRSIRRQRTIETWGRNGRRVFLGAGVLAVLSMTGLFLFRERSGPTPAPPPASVFVLPFRSDGTNQVDEVLLSRITDAFIDGLALIEGVKVGLRQSTILHRNEEEVRSEIGRRFKMRYALSGRVTSSTNSVRIRFELYDAISNQPFWSETEHDRRDRLGELEMRILQRVTSSLGVEVTPAEWKAIVGKLAKNLAAYEAFKTAPYGYVASKSDADAAVEVLNRATELDPNFVEAHLRLAHHYRSRSDVSLAPKVAVALERKAVLRALEVDPSSGYAFSRLAGIQCYYDWDWANAELNLQRAIQLNPSEPNNVHACLLETLGRWAEALRIWKESEKVAPASDFVLTGLYVNHFLQRRYDEAIAAAQKGIDLNPGVSVWHWMLGRCHQQLGDYVKAEQLIRKAQSIDDEPLLVGFLGHLYAAKGKANEARTELARLEEISHHRYVPAAFRAFIHVGLGEKNEAFACLDQAYQDRSETLVFSQSWPLKYDPIWDPLRSDPRYTNLLKRVNLEP